MSFPAKMGYYFSLIKKQFLFLLCSMLNIHKIRINLFLKILHLYLSMYVFHKNIDSATLYDVHFDSKTYIKQSIFQNVDLLNFLFLYYLDQDNCKQEDSFLELYSLCFFAYDISYTNIYNKYDCHFLD